jgi:hypothetical protein
MAGAVGVFYNYSGTLACYEPGGGPNPESDEDSNFWDYQWCSEMWMPSSRNGGEGGGGGGGGEGGGGGLGGREGWLRGGQGQLGGREGMKAKQMPHMLDWTYV